MEEGKVTLNVEAENAARELARAVIKLMNNKSDSAVDKPADKKVRISSSNMFFEAVMKLAEENGLSYRELNNYLERSINFLDRHQGKMKVKK